MADKFEVFEDDAYPIEVQSKGLRTALHRLDMAFLNLEDDNRMLRAERDEYMKKYGESMNASIKSSQQMMGQTLLACIGATPTAETIGPVGGVMITKIRDMQTIEEVHEYIEGLCKDITERAEEKA